MESKIVFIRQFPAILYCLVDASLFLPHSMDGKKLGVTHWQAIKSLLCKNFSEGLDKETWNISFDVVSEGNSSTT